MSNPWKKIDLNAYEKHMSLESVFQLQALNNIMKDQFNSYHVKSVMILGIAGGNGLEHINKKHINKVYGVDINKNYLDTCADRYPKLQDIFVAVHADLTQEQQELPYAEYIVANLLIEYIGYECFQKVVNQVSPKYVSAVIQINEGSEFVSDSPYIHVFDHLDKVHRQIKENTLINDMERIGYRKTMRIDEALPNGKKLVRIDFTIQLT